MILVIDNYDSFTYNLVQYLGGWAPTCSRAQRCGIDRDHAASKPERIVISPGRTPGAGRRHDGGDPTTGPAAILGVSGSPGHRAVFGGSVVRRPRRCTSKTSTIEHDGRGVFTGIEGRSPLPGTRSSSRRWAAA
jgi:anthranilate/para-aminobenzoate synthase component II